MSVEKIYSDNINQLKEELSDLKKRSNIWSYIRIIVFIGGFTVITILSGKLDVEYLILTTVLIFILLILSVLRHLNISHKIDSTKKLILINSNEINVINQKANIYSSGKSFAVEFSEISNDLDLFGSNSVFHMINRASTYFGNNILKNFFTNFTQAEQITERQKAVSELSDKQEWRQSFQKELIDISPENAYRKLTDFVESKSFIENNNARFNIYLFQNIVVLSIFIASLFFFSKYSFLLFMIIFMVNSAISLRYYKRTNEIHQMVSDNAKDLFAFSKALDLLEKQNWESDLLKSLVKENDLFSVQILNLKKLIQLFDYRLNMVVGTILNIFLLWDFRIIKKLDIWKRSNTDIEKHLKIIGEFEALNSFATLKYNNPGLCYAKISDKEFELNASNMFHPLIAKNEVISNSYDFSGTSRLDIITGPNMSGKSTFLRSVAINMILAGAGSVVFADKFVFTPSKVLTYLHITDSIKDKISTFRAEIIKLKSILEQIKSSDVPTFFILDEILRGTNSHSKFKGSVAIVKRLLELKSSGIIATHDVKLGEMEEDYRDHIRNFSFDFIVDKNDELVYDYKLKKGINTKVNAEIVLKELGLVL
ncbi:MAG: hypothetical protein ABFR62_14150 [Bacteroidota bacterium]